jgi:hypothetical protein
MQTLLLDQGSWDLTLDVNGNVAIASEPYALAQDAASAIKTFQGEMNWDTTIGVPYLSTILGKNPTLSYLKAQLVVAALTVIDIVSAVCYIASFENRQLVGQVQVTDASGQVSAMNFSTPVFVPIDPQGP